MLSSWLGTDRFGGKSQRRDATPDRFAHDDDDDDDSTSTSSAASPSALRGASATWNRNKCCVRILSIL